jgi:hypothetical protein
LLARASKKGERINGPGNARGPSADDHQTTFDKYQMVVTP